METETNMTAPKHFIECAFFRELGRPFLLPMLQEGMFVRDFATFVRDTLCIPQNSSVTLCDAWTSKPYRGLHWLLPNTALQIRVVGAPDDKPLRVAAVPLSSAPGEVVAVCKQKSSSKDRLHIHVFMDAIVTADGHGIGGVGVANERIRTSKNETVFKSIAHDKILDIRSAKACEKHFVHFAATYVRERFGKHAVPHIYCASMPEPSSSSCGKESERAFFLHWLDLATPELTLLRKESVRHYKQA